MTQKEFFKEEILEIACERKTLAVDKRTNKPCKCGLIKCGDCLFGGYRGTCRDALAEWLEEEYKEPCEFDKDELVEVSDNGVDWHLRYFSHIDKEGFYGKFIAFDGGKKSKDAEFSLNWKLCRKYGTLGGLVKGETE